MAGRVTELAALTGALAADDDLIEVVDISDTTLAATGTNKKMTLAEAKVKLSSGGGMFPDYFRPGAERAWVQPGMTWISGSMGVLSAESNVDYNHFMFLNASVSVTEIAARVTTGPTAAATMQLGCYAADGDGQPTGNPLWNKQIPISNGASGTFTMLLTPSVLLKAGAYLLVSNFSHPMSMACPQQTMFWAYESLSSYCYNTAGVARTHGSFPNGGTPWNNPTYAAIMSQFIRYTLA